MIIRTDNYIHCYYIVLALGIYSFLSYHSNNNTGLKKHEFSWELSTNN